MNIDRPLDFLSSLKNKKVIVYMKDGEIITGNLVSFDIHINLLIELPEKKLVFIKGDLVKKVEK